MREYPQQWQVSSVTAHYLDCCVSDHFQGSDYPELLAVPVHYGMTYKEAYEAAKNEFHASSGWFDDVSGSGTLVEDALRNLFGATIVGDVNAEADFVRHLEAPKTDEDAEPIDAGETVHLYIGLEPLTDD